MAASNNLCGDQINIDNLNYCSLSKYNIPGFGQTFHPTPKFFRSRSVLAKLSVAKLSYIRVREHVLIEHLNFLQMV